MNKILMDGDKLFLDKNCDKVDVNGSSIIFIKDLDSFKLEINVLDNSILNIYDFSTKNVNKEIIINQNNNTKVGYVHTFKIDGDYKLKYRANIIGNNNSNEVYISGVSRGNAILDVDGIVSKKTLANSLNENIKVLTITGKCFVAPKLHVSALDVIANHNTAISNIREDELFYLLSKGIDRNHAVSLIEDGYVYGIMKKYSEEFYNYIKC